MMPFIRSHMKFLLYTVPSLLLFIHQPVNAAMDAAFELDQKALSGLVTGVKTERKPSSRPRPARRATVRETKAVGTVYTVKQGDNLFRILMREYALSNEQAEALIEDVRRLNNIDDIKRLKVGQKITIPPVNHSVIGKKSGTNSGTPVAVSSAVDGLATDGMSYGLKLDPPGNELIEQATANQLRIAWDKLVPSDSKTTQPIRFESSSFSLELDPQRFPVFAAEGGGRIILDSGSAISPLVKSLIISRDPAVRIVSGPLADRKRVLGAMLESAGFYSVESDFGLEFGTDPKLRFNSDFKVEKQADSLIRQDVVLVSSGNYAVPATLNRFLLQEGFSLLEPFANDVPGISRSPLLPLLQIGATSPGQVVDTLLTKLNLPYQSQHKLDVFASDKNGISLSVNVDRAFEKSGKKFAVTVFDGNPVNYTLFRILETKGYKVIVLENRDDFHRITEKMMTSMQIPVEFSKHKMWQDTGINYSIQLSGFKIESPAVPGGYLFLTDRPLDPIIRDLLKENGYSIEVK
jgi:LysM repeat protein